MSCPTFTEKQSSKIRVRRSCDVTVFQTRLKLSSPSRHMVSTGQCHGMLGLRVGEPILLTGFFCCE